MKTKISLHLRLISGNCVFQGKKSELVECLQADVNLQSSMPTGINTIIIDAAATVNMIKPGVEKAFAGYAEKLFLPFIEAQLRQADRVDIV